MPMINLWIPYLYVLFAAVLVKMLKVRCLHVQVVPKAITFFASILNPIVLFLNVAGDVWIAQCAKDVRINLN